MCILLLLFLKKFVGKESFLEFKKHFLSNNNIVNNLSSWEETDFGSPNQFRHNGAESFHQNFRNYLVEGITEAMSHMHHTQRFINFRNERNKSMIEALGKATRAKTIFN